MNLEDLNSKITSSVDSHSKLQRIFRLVAGSSLASCKPFKVDALGSLVNDMVGDDSELFETILLDAVVLSTSNKGENASVVLDNSKIVARSLGCLSNSVSLDEQRAFVYGTLEIEGYAGGAVKGKEPEESSEEIEGQTEDSVEKREKEQKEKSPSKTDRGLEEAINRYYAQYSNGVIQELLMRYTALFSSGYQVTRPAGILANEGIVKVSGSSKTVYEESIATYKMYELLKSRIGFSESSTRSIVGIASTIYDSYLSGNREIIYFPNKMLEFAYGLCAPDGENQNSVNTYKKHSMASSWSKYLNEELTKAVRVLVRKSMYGFIVNTMEGDDYRNPAIADSLGSFLKYMQDCLSFCMLFTEYNITKVNDERDVANFTLRICDPRASILRVDLTSEILTNAFMGGRGKIPFSYQPRVEEDVFLVEYSHEFNHDLAQATPLFAYKVLDSILADGKNLSWDNLILGKGEDGKILKCGKDGFINLALALLHILNAGSRAGKGVMTLNWLASGIAARKIPFYLDDKPDMASVLKFLCNEMFVVNGAGYDPNYDTMNQWGPDKTDMLASMNVPPEALKAFGVKEATWRELGDIFYMRALMLIVGMLFARGSGKGTDPNWGGENGFMVIVDEFRVFQAGYRSLMNEVFAKIPNTIYEKNRDALAKGSITQDEFDRCYNDVNYYCLSYVNSLSSSLDFLAKKRDAGFDSSEVMRSDILMIGQDLYDGPVDINLFKNSFIKSSASNRYKTSSTGMNSTFGSTVCGATESIPYTFLTFKGADAFFGRNIDTNYLAQTNKGSKAYGRLDDKASNFAYLKNFNEGVREALNSGKTNEGMKIANECKYFKPYLILNESSMDSRCVQDMFDRCNNMAGISMEEIIQDNPNPDNSSEINPAVGFIDYIKKTGIEDYEEVLKQGAKVADYVVSLLGYPGNWMEFICDLRPEWMFTLEDIVDVAQERTPSLANPVTNPIHAEWVVFNPSRFGAEGLSGEEDFEESDSMSGFFSEEDFNTDSGMEDFSDMDLMDREADKILSEVMGEMADEISADDEIDLDDMYEPIEEGEVHETGFEGNSTDKIKDEQTARIVELLKELESLGVNLGGVNIGDEYTEEVKYRKAKPTEFTEEFDDINFKDDITSLESLMHIITDDVLSTFGGFERITSFKVIGGGIVINGHHYRCKVSNVRSARIPYDIRRDLNSGNVAKLFIYECLPKMLYLRDLEFDSTSFVYDYVRPQLGFGNDLSVIRFFDIFPSMMVLTIGKNRFDRNSYINQAKEYGNDLFYKPKRSTIIADASEEYLNKISSSSWNFARDLASRKNCNKLFKVVGVTAGATAAGVSQAARLGTKATRSVFKGTRALIRGVKDLLDN